jgi:hypothetical protein
MEKIPRFFRARIPFLSLLGATGISFGSLGRVHNWRNCRSLESYTGVIVLIGFFLVVPAGFAKFYFNICWCVSKHSWRQICLSHVFNMVLGVHSSNHSEFSWAGKSGADWHASIRSDQNHCTSGELPRFVRNFYEECRGPPRLFLLDKYVP